MQVNIKSFQLIVGMATLLISPLAQAAEFNSYGTTVSLTENRNGQTNVYLGDVNSVKFSWYLNGRCSDAPYDTKLNAHGSISYEISVRDFQYSNINSVQVCISAQGYKTAEGISIYKGRKNNVTLRVM